MTSSVFKEIFRFFFGQFETLPHFLFLLISEKNSKYFKKKTTNLPNFKHENAAKVLEKSL